VTEDVTEETKPRAVTQRVRGKIGPAVWVALVAASVALFAGLFYWQYVPIQQTNEEAAKAAITAASDGTAAVFSYSASTFDSDVSSAASHLTGDFLSEYQGYVQSGVAAVAQQKQVSTQATVVGAAVSELHPDSAVVLLFINQSTMSADEPAPSMAARSVQATMSKVDGKWLISSLKPV
jgi:Mce-associated membrane protein